MAVRFTDGEIAALLAEPKVLPVDFRRLLRPREKRGHREAELTLTGSGGHAFSIFVRQSLINALDFSVILAVTPEKSSMQFRLRRHNGKSHEHTNAIERNSFYDFHVHMATERYQELGMKEDGYAERTDRYSGYYGALSCFCEDCKVLSPPESEVSLFPGECAL